MYDLVTFWQNPSNRCEQIQNNEHIVSHHLTNQHTETYMLGANGNEIKRIWLNLLLFTDGVWARAIYDYQACSEEELSFAEGTMIKILRKDENGVDDGFWEGEINGQVGVFPSLVVEEIGQQSEDQVVYIGFCVQNVMPPEWNFEASSFWPVCLWTKFLHWSYLWAVRDRGFIFGIHTLLMIPFLCRLQSIAAHRDNFVWCLSVHPLVRLSLC